MLTSLLTTCNTNNKDTGSNVVIGKTLKIENGRLSAETMLSLGQVGGVEVSPDGKTILYGVTYTDISLNKKNRELFTVSLDGSNKKQITSTASSEAEAQWIADGKKIAFLCEGQIWTANPDGTKRRQITKYKKNIDGFKFSPDGKKLLFIASIETKRPLSEQYPDLDKASGKIIDDLMYKHWDEWKETAPHPFVVPVDIMSRHASTLQDAVDLLDGEPYESPLNPFGSIEQLAWSPDSKTVAYTSRKKTGKAYAQSTNSDIYLYNTETKTTANMTEGNGGYDTNPGFSPDGKHIAWLSMERDGYESDKNRLFVKNIETGETIYLTKNFDYNVDCFCWNSSDINFAACVKGTSQLFTVTPQSSEIRQITEGKHDFVSVAVAGKTLVALRHSMSQPNEIYTVNGAEQTNISRENDHILSQITMGKVEERWIKTTDNKEMLTWLIYPPDFDASKKYPALLYCQGGPQSTVSQFWSTRWNFQLMAAHDYIVIAPNRRGVPGFGTEWNEQISGDYGGQNMLDYLSAIDAVSAEPFVDETRLGCTGASYGGFSVYWLAGHHNKRFKAFWAHAGIFNLESQYLETEEMWFADWDLGGPFWDKTNTTAQKSYAASPHHSVGEWDTPVAVSCCELDYRVLASQGMMAFNAAQLRGIPSRMLIYPDENHWITKPQNTLLFHREFFRWFDQWLK
jgi:dipeptidyl aminopeptidase/acylaminoacyl peptidase